MKEEIEELRDKIDSDIANVGGIECFNNCDCANEIIISWIDRIIDIVDKIEEKIK